MCHWKRWIWPGILTVAILSAVALWLRTDAIEADVRAQAERRLASAGLDWAKVEVDGRDATVVGIAPLEGQESPVLEAVEDGYAVRIAEIRFELLAAQSPYTLGAVREGETVAIEGYVPNETVRAEILAGAKEAFPDATVEDRTQFARGAPDDLAARAAFGFSQIAGTDDGRFTLSDDTYSVAGRATTQETYASIDTALGALPSGLTLGERAVAAPVASPYTVAADYDGSAVRLTGFAPDGDTRAAVETAAGEALPEAEILNEIAIADGAPEAYSDQVQGALAVLPRLSRGQVSLSDGALTAEGVARSGADFETVEAALAGTLPGAATLAASRIELPSLSSYQTSATYDGSTVRLSGFAPDASARTAVENAARTALPDATVVNELELAAGAPEGYQEQVEGALAVLPRLSQGQVSLLDGALTVEGEARSGAEFETVEAALAGTLPGDATLAATRITLPERSPYTTSVLLEGDAVRLSGYAPDAAAREAVEAQVAQALPGARIVNELELAAGAPEGYGEQIETLASVLPTLENGRLSLDDGRLSASGAARTPESFDRAVAILDGDLGGGATLAARNLTAPGADPYTTNIDYDGTTATLTGFAPDRETREAVAADVSEALPGVEVRNELRIASGAPADYRARVGSGLAVLPRLSSGAVAVTGTSVAARGTALTSQDYETAVAVPAELPTDTSLDTSAVVPPVAEPYVTGATYDGTTVTLTGSAPDADARAAVEAAARSALPNATVVDELAFASGAPDGYGAQIESALSVLPRLSLGEVSLSDGALTANGTALTGPDFEAANAALSGKLGGGASLATAEIVPPTVTPYETTIALAEDTVRLSGFAPDVDTREGIARAVARALPNAPITNDIQIAAGAPEGFAAQVGGSVDLLPALTDAELKLTDGALDIEGTARTGAEYEATLQTLEGELPGSLRVARAEVTPPTATSYRTGLDYDGTNVVLRGLVPSIDTREAIEGSVRERLPEAQVENGYTIAAGAPDDLQARLATGFDYLPDLAQGRVDVENGRLNVSGTARDPEAFERLLSKTDAAGANDAISIRPATSDDYAFAAEYDGSKVALTGFAPDVATRSSIAQLTADRLPGAEVDNQLLIADGAPPSYLDQIAASLDYLPRLQEGRVGLDDGQVSVRGVARTSSDFDQATTNVEIGGALGAATLASREITPPAVGSYSFGADYEDDTVTLRGFVPDQSVRDAVLAAVGEALPEAKVEDRLEYAAGAPDGFAANAPAALAPLARFDRGAVDLSANGLRIRGQAASVDDYVGALEDLEGGAPAGVDVSGLPQTQVDIAPAQVSPYTFAAERANGTVRLTGYVPSKDERAAIEREAAAGGLMVTNDLRIAAGSGEGFSGRVDRGLAFLGNVETGSARIEDDRLTVEGRAAEIGGYETALAAAGQADTRGVEPAIAAPYRFEGALDASGETPVLSLQGFVPDDARREAVVAAARSAAPDATVRDELQIAAGEPSGFSTDVADGLAFLPTVDEARFTIEDDKVARFGRTRQPGELEAARSGAGEADVSGLRPPRVEPYAFDAVLEGEAVKLSGYVPDDDARAGIERSVRSVLPEAEVENGLLLAEGAPERFRAGAEEEVGKLVRLTDGRVRLDGDRFAVEGRARTSDDFVELATPTVRPPLVDGAYETRIERDGSSVVLSGAVPSVEARDTLRASVESAIPGATVEDRTTFLDGEPEGRVAELDRGVALLTDVSNGRAIVTGRALDVEGQAESVASYERSVEKQGSAPAAGAEAERIAIAPVTISPYSWSASESGDDLVLEGFVPSEEERARIVGVARQRAQGSVEDRQRIAAGAPEGFSGAVDAALAQFDTIERANASLTGTRLSLRGAAESEAAREEVVARLEGAVGDGFQVRPSISAPAPVVAVEETPAVPQPAEKEPAAVPAEEVPEVPAPEVAAVPEAETPSVPEVVEPTTEAPAALPAEEVPAVPETTAPEAAPIPQAETPSVPEVVEQTTEAPAAVPAEEAPAVPEVPAPEVAAVPEVELPSVPEVAEPPVEEPASVPAEEAPAVPEVAAVEPEAEPVERAAPQTCDVDFNALFQGDKVLFATNRAIIREVSFPLLDRIAAAKKRCDNASFRITGHTDSRGAMRYNARLSEARANAVRDYMVKAGVPADKIVAQGAGETEPIASNRTRAGRQRNRRIEFTIIE